MRKKKLIAFIPNLLFGLTLAQALPAFSQTSITPLVAPTNNQAFVGQAFVPSISQAEVFIPIVYFAGSSDRPEPGFYHQAILLQKVSINYENSKILTVDLGDEKSEGFIVRKEDFKY